jgi:hypothetical protein
MGSYALGTHSTEKKEGKVVAAKLIVYAGEDDEYYTLISRET